MSLYVHKVLGKMQSHNIPCIYNCTTYSTTSSTNTHVQQITNNLMKKIHHKVYFMLIFVCFLQSHKNNNIHWLTINSNIK